jgi:hypothetical protein
MVGFSIIMAFAFATFAALGWRAAVGLRDGDRPADAKVVALLRDSGQPDEPRPVVIALVRNPSDKPVLAGMSARRAVLPDWLRGGPSVTVPIRTARRALRPTAYTTVGVVPARSYARFPVPTSGRARRYQLIAAIGQAGGRLRVHRLHVGGPHSSARTELTLPFDEDLFD